MCSAILPGAGQWLLHQRVRAVIFWVLLVVLLVLWIPLRLPHSLFGFLLAVLLTIVLWLASARDALLGFRHGDRGERRIWLAVLLPIALVIALADSVIFLHLGGFHTLKVASNGMEPAVMAGDRVMVSRRKFTPVRNDIVYFARDGRILVKRVIGLGGNVVQGSNGSVTVNNVAMVEPFVQHTGPHMPNLENFGPVDVPQGSLFVMGDNRDVSLDSRMRDFGTVDSNEIKGRPIYILTAKNPLRIGRAVR